SLSSPRPRVPPPRVSPSPFPPPRVSARPARRFESVRLESYACRSSGWPCEGQLVNKTSKQLRGRIRMKRFTVICLSIALAGGIFARTGSTNAMTQRGLQEDERQDGLQEPTTGAPPASAVGQEFPFPRPGQTPEIKPYEKVITKDAKSTPGVF